MAVLGGYFGLDDGYEFLPDFFAEAADGGVGVDGVDLDGGDLLALLQGVGQGEGGAELGGEGAGGVVDDVEAAGGG